MVGVAGSFTCQSCPGDIYGPFEPSSSPLGHSQLAQRERKHDAIDTETSGGHCLHCTAERARGTGREGGRGRRQPANFCPFCPAATGQKNDFEDLSLKAFLVASGLLKAGSNSLYFILACGESNEPSSIMIR